MWTLRCRSCPNLRLQTAPDAQDAGGSARPSVLILEKGPLAGGHSLYSSGTVSAVAPERAEAIAGRIRAAGYPSARVIGRCEAGSPGIHVG